MESDCHSPSVRTLDVEFSEVEELCESIRSWNLDFRPLSAPSKGGRLGRIVQSRCGPVELSHARITVSLDQRGVPPAGMFTFVILESVMHRLWWRGHDVDQDTVPVFPIGSELQCISGSDFGVHTISVDEGVIERACAAREIDLLPQRRRAEIFRASSHLLDGLRRLLRLLMEGERTLSPAETEAALQDLLVAWMSSGEATSRSRPCLRARDRAVRKSLEIMEEVDWVELSPAQLSDLGGVSERTLQYAFRERFGLTPAAFLKARRLAAVRNELRRARASGCRISDVMARYGFWHMGQFASDYRRVFGELPSDTVKAA